MKKNVVIFMLLAIFALAGTVFAQAPDLPAIDAEAAEAYLGIWNMDQMCEKETCIPVGALGMKAILELNADNTLSMTFEGEEPDVSYWYMEDGAAYMVTGSDNTGNMLIDLNDEGSIVIGDGSTSMTFKRDTGIQYGTAEVKADAVYEDFQGEWFLTSMMSAEMSLPAGLLGMEGTLVIREDSLDIVISDETSEDGTNIPYTLENGVITAEITSEGETEPVKLEYHVDDSVVITFSTEEDGEFGLVFVRKENLTDLGFNLGDLLSNAE